MTREASPLVWRKVLKIFKGQHFVLVGQILIYMVMKGETCSVFVGREGVGFRYFLHLSRNIESKPLYCCIVKIVHFFSFVIKDLKKCPSLQNLQNVQLSNANFCNH